jgi:hypothetical protein
MREIVRKLAGFFDFEGRRRQEMLIAALKVEIIRRKRHGLPYDEQYRELHRLQGRRQG